MSEPNAPATIAACHDAHGNQIGDAQYLGGAGYDSARQSAIDMAFLEQAHREENAA